MGQTLTHTHVTLSHPQALHLVADTLLGQVSPIPQELGLACPPPHFLDPYRAPGTRQLTSKGGQGASSGLLGVEGDGRDSGGPSLESGSSEATLIRKSLWGYPVPPQPTTDIQMGG